MNFPNDFLWAVATSSYQIEGAALEEGRGECIWTRFSHTPGKVANNETGDIACDHYHLYHDDVALMRELGIQAYRFSVAWSRVLPAGTGAINTAGLDFYDRLVDALLAANIMPFLTLYHWDLPQALQDQGGWENPASVEWFAAYTDVMTGRLGDRVKHWTTHNEPFVVAFVGNWEGRHSPGIQDLPVALRVAHHLLLSHAASLGVIRQRVPDAKAGIVLNHTWFDAASERPEDQKARQNKDGFVNRWFLDPVMRGHYPADTVELFGNALAGIDLSAVQAVAVPLDFIGVNYYTREVCAWDANHPPFFSTQVRQSTSPHTEMDWEVYPTGLTNILNWLHTDYAVPAIYIAENGAAFNDPPPQHDVVKDPDRLAYLKAHFQAAHDSLQAGVPLKGYFVWSFLDNFEWAYGYAKRFGIIHVDFATLKRTWKESARWYQSFIREQLSRRPTV